MTIKFNSDMNQISLKVKPETKKRLEQIAKEEEVSVSDIVRSAIKEKIMRSSFGNKSIHLMTKKDSKARS